MEQQQQQQRRSSSNTRTYLGLASVARYGGVVRGGEPEELRLSLSGVPNGVGVPNGIARPFVRYPVGCSGSVGPTV